MSSEKKFASTQQARSIESIYETLGEATEDLSVVKPPSLKKRWWILGILLALTVIAGTTWLGYRVFNPAKTFQEDKVSIKIDGPRTVSSSEQVTYTLTYRNEDPNPMTNVIVSTEYPEGFTVISTDPTTDTQHNNQWKIGLLKTGESGVVQIQGQWHGNPGDNKTLKASMNYVPANFNSPFHKEDILTVTVQSSLLHAQIQGSTQLNPGDDAQYEITYDDFSDIYKKDEVQLRLIYPKGLTVKEVTPISDIEKDTWSATALLTNVDPITKKGAIKINGNFNAETPAGTVELIATLGYNHENVFTMEKEERFSTEISQGDLIMRLRINDAQTMTSVHVGDQLTMVVNYENQGKYPLTDISLDATLDGSFVNWSTIRDMQTASFDHNTLTWNSNSTPALATLKPGGKGQVSFRVSVYNHDDLLNVIQSGLVDQTKEFVFTGSAHATYQVTPYKGGATTGETLDMKTGKMKITVNSDLELGAQARYFNDDQSSVGSGPLPPVVGQTTTYAVMWRLTNSLHDLEQVRLTTILPAEVTWANQERTDSGTLSYDATTRTVSWVVDRMPASTPTITSQFAVSITPTASYVQKLMTLTGDTGVTAQDSINQSKISLKRSPLTTNLDFDPVGKGKGLVQP